MTGSRGWHRLGLWMLLGLVASLVAGCVPAQIDGEGISVRREFTLAPGETRRGDQVIVAYRITLEEDSRLDGDATLTADRVTVDGIVAGDVVVVADHFVLGPSARIEGGLVLCVKTLEQYDEARVVGAIREECADTGRTSASAAMHSGWDSWRGSALFRLGSVAVGALLYGGLAALLTALFPRPLVRMSESVRRSPVAAGGVGLLTMIVAVAVTGLYGLSLLLVLPVVLLPFVLIAWLIILLLSLFGWVAVAQPIGASLLSFLGRGSQPRMITAAVGAVALTLLVRVWSIVWVTAWIAAAAAIVLASVGLGAVILTRFGTRPYPRLDLK